MNKLEILEKKADDAYTVFSKKRDLCRALRNRAQRVQEEQDAAFLKFQYAREAIRQEKEKP